MHGVAVSGLLARTLEHAVVDAGRGDLIPARYQVDLFRPAKMVPTTASATVVREGPRLMLVDAVVQQDGTVVARASGTFLRSSDTPGGTVWGATDRATPPAATAVPPVGEHHVPYFSSDRAWSQKFGEHQNAGRHATWQTAVPIVIGEEMTPFQSVASAADATSMVTNWGSAGIEYINTDINLTLVRRPDGTTIGIRANDHVAVDGIAVGTAEVFDRSGTLGTATVTSMANARRTVDLGGEENPVQAPPGV
ncbi:thioesterase family protein [Nocardioides sp. BGMRC 2183]|nr:thioesterase family protein [Nocardioides sp. BGMRC 2183]